jgi:hypothetical protein
MQPVAEHIDYKLLYEQQKATNEELQYQLTALTLQLEKFKKMVFGSKNERFVATNDTKTELQLKLDLDAETIAAPVRSLMQLRLSTSGLKQKSHPILPKHILAG